MADRGELCPEGKAENPVEEAHVKNLMDVLKALWHAFYPQE
jgi:hypothetical protein